MEKRRTNSLWMKWRILPTENWWNRKLDFYLSQITLVITRCQLSRIPDVVQGQVLLHLTGELVRIDDFWFEWNFNFGSHCFDSLIITIDLFTKTPHLVEGCSKHTHIFSWTELQAIFRIQICFKTLMFWYFWSFWSCSTRSKSGKLWILLGICSYWCDWRTNVETKEPSWQAFRAGSHRMC